MRRLAVLLVLLLPVADAQPSIDRNAVHNVFTVDALFADWEETYPDFVQRITIGRSEGGMPLHGIVVTDESVPFDAPPHSATTKHRVYLDGGHHGNEFLGVEITLYYMEQLLDLAAQGDAATLDLLGSTEIQMVPILNVEGNLRDTRVNLNGVDPNRNYDFGHTPCSIPGFTCGGPAPFSESEIRANADHVLTILPDLWLSMHTGIEVLFYPAGEPFPGGQTVDQGLFDAMEGPFEEAAGGRIDMTGGPAPAVGSAEDWGYAVVGVNSFVYEVHNDQNLPVYGEPISDLLQDQIDGLAWLVEGAATFGALVELEQDGPDVVARNVGLGEARNVTVASAAGTMVIPSIAPGQQVRLSGIHADVTWSYPKLLVDTSQHRTHAGSFADAPEPISNDAPIGWLALPALAIALLLRRYR